MQRGGRCDVLQMGFGCTPLPGIPPPIAAPRLRRCPFHARTPFLLLRAFRTTAPRPRCLHRLVRRTWREAHTPSLLLRSGADRPRATGLAVFQRTLHEDRPAVRRRAGVPPRDRPCALWAAPALLDPLHLKLVDGIAACPLRLPPLDRPGRTTQGDPVRLLTLAQSLRVDIGRIDQGLARRQRFLE